MRDLTSGSITGHILSMAGFIGLGLIVNTLYVLVDLYFVSHLGDAAMAGVATGGTATFITIGLSQLIAVGSLSLISQAVGRKDDADAQLIFEQALSLSILAVILTLAIGYGLGGAWVSLLSADATTAALAREYLFWFLPSLATMFPMAALGSALRASGVVAPGMIVQVGTLGLNIVLAPVLIAGWGTGHPLGVAGAGLASSLAAVIGLVGLALTFNRFQRHLHLHAALTPRLAVWRRIAAIGLPSSLEFSLMFVVMGVVYWALRDFGAHAQAGYGIGSRVMQSIFLPAMAVAFAAAPVAGQNFGAMRPDRVRAVFVSAALIGSTIMVALTVFSRAAPEVLIGPFTQDAEVAAIAAEYLKIISLNYVASGLTFTCSGMFQGLGDTRPSLIGSGSRLLTFVVPVLFMAGRPGVELHDYWYLSVASSTLQTVIVLILLRSVLRRKLGGMTGLAAEE